MIIGGIFGLLAAIAYTLVTGKLQLTRGRYLYDMPARVVALLGLIPMLALVIYVTQTGKTVNQPGGLGLFFGMLVASILIIYIVGWPFGQPPR